MNRFTLTIALLALTGCPKQAPVEVAPVPDPEAWRASQPAAGPDTDWQAPVAARFELSNGIPVYLVENHGLPLVTVRVTMAVGRDANPAGKAGLHALTASMLDEGTKKHTGSELAAALAELGAELSVWGGGDSSAVSLDALGGEQLPASLDLLAEVLREPRFAKADFDRVKQQTLDQIAADKADPRQVARLVFASELFGASHPYGQPISGDAASVTKLTLADVQKLYKDQWHAGNAMIVVAGDVDAEGLQRQLERRLGGWKVGKGGRAELAVPEAPAATRVVFVEQPGAVQSVILAGRPAMARTSPEYWPANLGGTLFGGMFGSRLNMNLREEHGWSYGAYGGFSDDRAVGTFSASSSVQADKTAPAVVEILKEMEAARRDPTAEELKLARDSLAKSLPGWFETNHATAGAFAGALANGLGPDAWRTYTADLMAPDAAAVGAASRKWLDPSQLVVVVVGPRSVDVEEDGVQKTVDVFAEVGALGYPLTDLER